MFKTLMNNQIKSLIMGKVYHRGTVKKWALFAALTSTGSLVFCVYLLLNLTNIAGSATTTDPGDLLKVHFLNIGQGDAILIQAPNKNSMLIDSGPQNEKVISEIQKFTHMFDRTLNALLITHADADHIGSMKKVMEDFDYQTFMHGGLTASTNLFKDLMISADKSKTIVLTAGMSVMLDEHRGIKFDVLFPDFDFQINAYKDCREKILAKEAATRVSARASKKAISKKLASSPAPKKDACLKFINTETNLNSIVGRLSYGSTSFMLTGDAPIEVERFILSKYGDVASSTFDLRSDVLKLGHHGSKTSTALEFLQNLRPEFLIVSAGKDNRYGHPHKRVLDAIEVYAGGRSNQAIQIMRTDIDGTVSFESNGKDVEAR